MSRWTHSICVECWIARNPGRKPVRVITEEKPQPCCFCGDSHVSGIYVRHDPEELICKGEHS
jgi:hypothetical protein